MNIILQIKILSDKTVAILLLDNIMYEMTMHNTVM